MEDIQEVSPIIRIASLVELDAIILRNANVVVYFFTDWCPICKSMSPVFESVASSGKFKDVVFCKVDCDLGKDAARKMGIETIPETVMFRHGDIAVRLQSYIPVHGLENAVRYYLSENRTDDQNASQFDTSSSEHGELNTDQESAYLNSLPACTGDQASKGKRSKVVPDPERNCVHTPMSKDDRLRIGKASDGLSEFVITFWNDPRRPNKIFFDVVFMPDPTESARFESAMVSFTFGTHTRDGKRLPLKIRDISPIAANVAPTVRHEEDVEKPQRPDDEISLFSSFSAEPESEGTTIPGTTQVRGQGIGTPTALWTFEENKAVANVRGLIANHELSVTLPDTRNIWITFWAKAVLERQSSFWKRKVTLQIGSVKSPYERIVDLSQELV